MDQYGVNLEVTLEKGVNTFILQKLNWVSIYMGQVFQLQRWKSVQEHITRLFNLHSTRESTTQLLLIMLRRGNYLNVFSLCEIVVVHF